METLNAIRTRRSVRQFTGQPISHDQLEALIEAGMYAPSAHDRRPWVFVTTTRPETLAHLAEKGRWWKMLPQAGTGILVCADMEKGEGLVPEMHLSGCNAAIQNILLAAHDMGLGAVWLGVCEGSDLEPVVRETFHLPDHIRVVGMVAVGNPVKEPAQPETRVDKSLWHEEQW